VKSRLRDFKRELLQIAKRADAHAELARKRKKFEQLYGMAMRLAAEAMQAEEEVVKALRLAGADHAPEYLTDRPWINRAELVREFGEVES